MRKVKYFIRSLFSAFSKKVVNYHVGFYNQELIKRGLLTVGFGTYGHPIIQQYDGSESKVIIGNFTSIAKDVRIIAGGIHRIDTVSQYPFRANFNLEGKYLDGNPYTKGNIEIGSDVWIGTAVIILSGVKIGHGCIIGAGAIVTHDLPPYSISFGIPAKVNSYRFTEFQIKQLLKIEWWNWPFEKITDNVTLLTNESVDLFIKNNLVN